MTEAPPLEGSQSEETTESAEPDEPTQPDEPTDSAEPTADADPVAVKNEDEEPYSPLFLVFDVESGGEIGEQVFDYDEIVLRP